MIRLLRSAHRAVWSVLALLPLRRLCGRAPEPFRERVPTFRVRLVAGRVQVYPRPLPPGTRVEPVEVAHG